MLADFGGAQPGEIGTFVLIVCGVIGAIAAALACAHYARSLWLSFVPGTPKIDDAPVTQRQLAAVVDKIEAGNAAMMAEIRASLLALVPRTEFDVKFGEVGTRLTMIDKYLQQKEHKLDASMQTLFNKFDLLNSTVHRQVGFIEAFTGVGARKTDPTLNPER